MKLSKIMQFNLREERYVRKYMQSVGHATLNPEQPGAVQIHLIPPRNNVRDVNGIIGSPSVVILNGNYIVPIKQSYAILMNQFLRELDKYSGTTLKEFNLEKIIRDTVNAVHKVYYNTPKQKLIEDLSNWVHVFSDIALGHEVEGIVGFSIGEYAPFMRGPHRMDLMISAMEKNGCWNCNQKCIHCYAAGQEKSNVKELSTAEWKRIIDKLYNEACVAQVTFTGGEPTKRKDLVELVKYAEKMVTRVNTNGILLSEEYCDKLRKANLDSIQITFYSGDPEVHNHLVGVPMYNRTLAGIKNAIAAGLNVSINTPLCSLNKDYVETLRFLKELGIQYVTCSSLIITGNATTNVSKTTQLKKDELMSILAEAASFCKENDMEISFTSPGWLSEEEIKSIDGLMTVPMCGACLSNMAIAPNGEVVPCQSWLDGFTLGNMLNTDWTRIWDSEECSNIKNDTAKGNFNCPLKSMNETKMADY